MVFHFLFNLIPLLPPLHLITPHPVEKNISEEEVFLLPHSLNAGTEVEAYVTTSLSSDGVFWAQVEGGEEYVAMMERLQEVVGEMSTPVLFRPGILCAALFKDNLWYRARVESLQGEMVSGEGCEPCEVMFTYFLMFPSLTVHCAVYGLWQC